MVFKIQNDTFLKYNKNIFIRIAVLNLIVIILFSGITYIYSGTKVTKYHSQTTSESLFFSFTLPTSGVSLFFKNENNFQNNYQCNNNLNFGLQGISKTYTTKAHSPLLFSHIIKIRYFYPFYIYNRVFRI